MDSKTIKAALVNKGITQVDIALNLGVSKQVISQVISGSRKSRRVQEYISKLLKKNFEDVWKS